MREALGKAINVENKRNRIVHSIWVGQENEELLTRLKKMSRFGKGFQIDHEKVSVSAINEVADEIKGLLRGLFLAAKVIALFDGG